MQVPRGRGWGAYIRRSDLTEGFLRYEFGRGGGGLYLEGLISGILRYSYSNESGETRF